MKTETEKPLFIPLKWPHYWAFANNSKRIEYRKDGARWNARTCRIGREVILSCGYGKRNRLRGVITKFESKPLTAIEAWDDVTESDIETLRTLGDDLDYFACIEIGDIKPITT